MTSPDHPVVLVGMMGTGKSTVGRLVADALDAAFVDTDELVEGTTGRSVAEIFADGGEADFRTAEAKALRSALNRSGPVVIATGGGVLIEARNRSQLKKAGADVIWLDAPVSELAERVRRDSDRPLLEGSDPTARLRELLDIRRPLYAKCSSKRVDAGRSPNEVARDIVGHLDAGPSGGP